MANMIHYTHMRYLEDSIHKEGGIGKVIHPKYYKQLLGLCSGTPNECLLFQTVSDQKAKRDRFLTLRTLQSAETLLPQLHLPKNKQL